MLGIALWRCDQCFDVLRSRSARHTLNEPGLAVVGEGAVSRPVRGNVRSRRGDRTFSGRRGDRQFVGFGPDAGGQVSNFGGVVAEGGQLADRVRTAAGGFGGKWVEVGGGGKPGEVAGGVGPQTGCPTLSTALRMSTAANCNFAGPQVAVLRDGSKCGALAAAHSHMAHMPFERLTFPKKPDHRRRPPTSNAATKFTYLTSNGRIRPLIGGQIFRNTVL